MWLTEETNFREVVSLTPNTKQYLGSLIHLLMVKLCQDMLATRSLIKCKISVRNRYSDGTAVTFVPTSHVYTASNLGILVTNVAN